MLPAPLMRRCRVVVVSPFHIHFVFFVFRSHHLIRRGRLCQRRRLCRCLACSIAAATSSEWK